MNLNEGAWPPSPLAIDAMKTSLCLGNSYPDHDCMELAFLISNQTGIATDRISFGNGSGELLIAAATISINRSDNAIFPSPTFPTCAKGVQLAGGHCISVPVTQEGICDIEAMLDHVDENTGLFYVCTPNNPTGGKLDPALLRLAVSKVPNDCLLVVDEAYYEFSAFESDPQTLEILSKRTGPWVVTRSFSKAYCLAGQRIGYVLTSDVDLQRAFWKLRGNFNVNRAGTSGAIGAMRDVSYLNMVLTDTITQREALRINLEKLGFHVFPSSANFLTARPLKSALYVAAELAKQNILVQFLPWPDEHGSLRITIGRAGQMERLVTALSVV